MENNNAKRCVRCVMPETYPGVTFDEQGLCNFCRHYEKRWAQRIGNSEWQSRSEEKLRGIFEAAKRKNKTYDALVGISGGKDSSYMLYLCCEVYGLKVLSFTKDGGYLAEEAKARIEKLVKTFKVPHLYFPDPLTPILSRIFMEKTGNFCGPCEISTFNMSAIIAREYDIPLFIIGSSSRTEAGVPKNLNPWDPWYFRNVMKGAHHRERLRCSCYGRNYIILEGIARLLGKRRLVVLPNYLEWDEEKIKELFAHKYGIHFGEEHSDCTASPVAKYLYTKKLGGNDPRVAKLSLLVRSGKMNRETALEKLSAMQDNRPPLVLDSFLKFIGMTRQEFDIASEKTPDPYLTGMPRMFNKLRKKVRRQAA